MDINEVAIPLSAILKFEHEDAIARRISTCMKAQDNFFCFEDGSPVSPPKANEMVSLISLLFFVQKLFIGHQSSSAGN